MEAFRAARRRRMRAIRKIGNEWRRGRRQVEE